MACASVRVQATKERPQSYETLSLLLFRLFVCIKASVSREPAIPQQCYAGQTTQWGFFCSGVMFLLFGR
jgi:hypothetical protein